MNISIAVELALAQVLGAFFEVLASVVAEG